jgi:O-antigen/teichoic acid export membrane protein
MYYNSSRKFSSHTRKLVKNAGILLGGNAVSAIFSFAAMALMARALTLEDFGRYALVTASINLIDRLVNFQSWQAIIHFSASAQESGDDGKLISLFSFGWLLDVSTGVIGYLLIIALSVFMPNWIGLGDDVTLFVAVGGCLILFNWMATPTAILRFYDKFYHQVFYQNITAGMLLCSTAALWFAGQDSLLPYVVALTLSGLTGNIYFFAMAVRELRRRELLDIKKIDIREVIKTTPRLWRFLITTNMDGMVRVFRDIDVFILNALLGPASVALYKIARTLTKVFGRITGPVFQAIYPELSKLLAAKSMDDFIALMKQTAKIMGLVCFPSWLLFLVLGPTILEYGFGQDYVQAFGVASLCTAAMVVWSMALPLSPAMMALGKVDTSLIIHVATTFAYLLMLLVFVESFGLIGSGLALLVFYILWTVAMLIAIRRHLRVV